METVREESKTTESAESGDKTPETTSTVQGEKKEHVLKKFDGAERRMKLPIETI